MRNSNYLNFVKYTNDFDVLKGKRGRKPKYFTRPNQLHIPYNRAQFYMAGCIHTMLVNQWTGRSDRPNFTYGRESLTTHNVKKISIELKKCGFNVNDNNYYRGTGAIIDIDDPQNVTLLNKYKDMIFGALKDKNHQNVFEKAKKEDNYSTDHYYEKIKSCVSYFNDKMNHSNPFTKIKEVLGLNIRQTFLIDHNIDHFKIIEKNGCMYAMSTDISDEILESLYIEETAKNFEKLVALTSLTKSSYKIGMIDSTYCNVFDDNDKKTKIQKIKTNIMQLRKHLNFIENFDPIESIDVEESLNECVETLRKAISEKYYYHFKRQVINQGTYNSYKDIVCEKINKYLDKNGTTFEKEVKKLILSKKLKNV